MKNKKLGKVLSSLLVAVLVSPGLVSAQQDVSEEAVYRLANQIRKKILTLNNFGVFDFPARLCFSAHAEGFCGKGGQPDRAGRKR